MAWFGLCVSVVFIGFIESSLFSVKVVLKQCKSAGVSSSDLSFLDVPSYIT